VIDWLAVWPAKSLAVMRKLVPPRALPPFPLQLEPPVFVSETVLGVPPLSVKETMTDATPTSSVTKAVHELVGAVPLQFPLERTIAGASPPRVVFTVTVNELSGPTTVIVEE
jgi:hypothetical protein